jgi:hypothetical protein
VPGRLLVRFVGDQAAGRAPAGLLKRQKLRCPASRETRRAGRFASRWKIQRTGAATLKAIAQELEARGADPCRPIDVAACPGVEAAGSSVDWVARSAASPRVS